ncbi:MULTISPECIES: DUF2970 domain-containing protein [Grimontia]|uniref:DUF2970 domain-containing protein n=1 Tax=Grimontia marina TaxID=646534 RepID=A0A128F0N4_9GAMM|nr:MULTISPECIES: DUF2970 domain-containing protein [Grimontia]WRV96894.1 DUF2970 domain-containing protein [Grimontia sp. NTOU-MAR1]CZF80353.1 hypothetical protein GMA8713_01338 [Grimontia marina]
MDNEKAKQEKVGMADVVKSVFAAMFGVQSDKNRQRDFQQASMVPYIIVGFVFVAVFVLGLMGLVSLITPN